ncbi:MAG: dynamin family protein [Saprospiraceae bacterium]|nr:dynamin family protein [Saprospiraceae bacterium]
MSHILNQKILGLKARVAESVKELHQLTLDIGHQELSATVNELRNRIDEPFMFVIVGEVKAGKSSFINALLEAGEEITEVGPQPVTDTVQQILYGETPETVVLNPYLKRIHRPIPILKEIAIVDTPGTNTIIEQHQEITERFIPASDLIIFVFEAKNPYRQSAWQFFDFINADWRKKTIFVLQQKDLMPHEDLVINIQGVHDHAHKKGLTDPLVFAVSAKQELDGQLAESGFIEVREYIRNYVTGGKAPVLKLQNNLDTAYRINEQVGKGIQDREKQWEADVVFRADIKESLEKQANRAIRQVDVLVENLQAGYDRISHQKQQELASGLSFWSLIRRSVAGIFRKQASAAEWLETLAADLEKDLKLELHEKLQYGVSDLAESIQEMAKMIDMKIANSQTILKNNHAIFSDIAEKRAQVLADLQNAFSTFLNRSENFSAAELFPNTKSLSPNLVTGSGIAVVGAILTALTQSVAFDITGGVLTTIGLLFAGITTTVKKRQIQNGFRKELEKGKDKLGAELKEKLLLYIDQIQTRIDSNFEDFDQLLNQEEIQIKKLAGARHQLDKQIDETRMDVSGVLLQIAQNQE